MENIGCEGREDRTGKCLNNNTQVLGHQELMAVVSLLDHSPRLVQWRVGTHSEKHRKERKCERREETV